MENIKNSVLRFVNSNPNRSFTPLQMAVIEKQLSLAFPNFQTPTHPTYASMIQTAIKELNEENGSNEESISEFIKVHYEGLPWAHGVYLSHHLNELCKNGELGFDSTTKCYSCITSEGILFKGCVLGKNLPKKGFKKGRKIIDDVNLNGFQEEGNLECRESQSKRRRQCLVFEGDCEEVGEKNENEGFRLEDRNEFVKDCDHALTVGVMQENHKGVSSKVKDSSLKETDHMVGPYKDNDTPNLAVSSGTNSISEGSSPMIVCDLVQPSKQQEEGSKSSSNKSLEESQEKKKVSEKSMPLPTFPKPVDHNLVGIDQLDELSTQISVDSKESEMESVWGSPWLMPMLKCHYFLRCSVHKDLVKSERNMFCLDCMGDAFCFNCLSHHVKDHRVVQIRKSSRQYAVRVDDIKMHLDISHIQPYIINSANVVYLNSRPLPKAARSVSHPCETCGYSLIDSFRFCSLACKLHATLLNTSMIEESPVDQNQQVYCLEDGLKQLERHRCMDPLDPSSQNELLRVEDEEHLPLQKVFQKGKRKEDYAQIPTARERPPEPEINSTVDETKIHEQETDAGNYDSDAGPPGFVGTGHLMLHSLQSEPIIPQNIEKQKRGRGRPRKDKGAVKQIEATQEQAVVLSNLPHREQVLSDLAIILNKRGRGRPRKQLKSSSKQHIKETKNKGKEKPQKHIDPTKEDDVMLSNLNPQQPAEESLQVRKVKKGRGRPRKQKETEKDAAVSKKLHIGERETQSESGIYLNLQKLAKKAGRGRPKKPSKGSVKCSGTYKKFHIQPDKQIRKNGRGRPRIQDENKEDSKTQLDVEAEQSKTDIQNSNPSDEMRKPEESLAEVHRKPETEQAMCPLDAVLQQEVQHCRENKSKREDSENRSRPLKEKSTKSAIWVPLSSKDLLRSRTNRKSQDNV